MKQLLLFIFIACSVDSFGSNQDSLIGVYEDTSLPDTIRLKAIFSLSHQRVFNQPDSAIYFATKTMELARKTNNLYFQAEAYQALGTANYGLQQVDTAIHYYQKSLELYKKVKNENGAAAIYNNIGIMYEIKGDYVNAIACYLEGITIRERQNKTLSMARLNINIGNVYIQLLEHAKARSYYLKALKGFKKTNDSTGIAQTYMAIGLSHQQFHDKDSSIYYLNKSLNLHQQLNNVREVNQCKSNLGSIYQTMQDYSKAMEYFQASFDYFKNTNDIINKTTLYEDLGSLHIDLKNYSKGIELCQKSLELSETYDLREITKNSCTCLYEGYEGLNNFKKALTYYKKFMAIKDSIVNDDITKQITRAEVQHQYDKKLFSDSLERSKQERIKELEHAREVEKQKTYSYVGAIGATLLLVILLILFKGYRQKKKSNVILEQKNELITQQKQEVETQKHLIEEKSKEITDSIAYAKNIQHAILPPMTLFNKHLPDGFVYFQPKDVVSGDFYWMETILSKKSPVESSQDGSGRRGGKTVFFAVADCTGHGVPGAMVSVVCSNALSRAVKEFQLNKPGEILDKSRELVIETFAKSDRDVKDGMDISLCALTGHKLLFAGAHNPLWILRKGNNEMEEIKGDKQPVGSHVQTTPFTTHEIELKKGDAIYLFTDGYPDQFGGSKGKKLKYKPFQQILLRHANDDTSLQKTALAKDFTKWKGKNDQIDDVCVMCVKMD